jgi:hypothetical protein
MAPSRIQLLTVRVDTPQALATSMLERNLGGDLSGMTGLS